MNLFKSVLHNIGVLFVGLGLAFIGTKIDEFAGIAAFTFPFAAIIAIILLLAGFLLRVWATYHFYSHQMNVISLEPQNSLITTGPFRYSRNPLYLGGNDCIFLGAGLLLGSPTMLVFTLLHLPLMDIFIRREEMQLAAAFGNAWVEYTKETRRWI